MHGEIGHGSLWLFSVESQSLSRSGSSSCFACCRHSARSCKRSRGDPAELQQTPELVEKLTKQHQQTAIGASTGEKKKREQREEFGPKEQLNLVVDERVYELDELDCTCPTCGGRLRPMEDQFEESEMVDVIEVSYRLVKVKQQKYNCRRGAEVQLPLWCRVTVQGWRCEGESERAIAVA